MFPPGSKEYASSWIGDSKYWWGVIVFVYFVLKSIGVPFRVYLCFSPNVPRMRSGFITTLIRVKQLLKLNEWIYALSNSSWRHEPWFILAPVFLEFSIHQQSQTKDNSNETMLLVQKHFNKILAKTLNLRWHAFAQSKENLFYKWGAPI